MKGIAGIMARTSSEWHNMLDISKTAKQNYLEISKTYPVNYQAVKKALQRLKKQLQSAIEDKNHEDSSENSDSNNLQNSVVGKKLVKEKSGNADTKTVSNKLTYRQFCELYFRGFTMPAWVKEYDTIATY